MSEEYREPREPVPSTRSSRDPSQLPETPEAPVPPPPTKRVGQRIWLKALLLIGIFVSGAVVGGGVAVVSIVRKIQHNIEHPELRPERWTQRVESRLDLTADETEAVRRVFVDASERVDDIHRDVWPRLKEELTRIETDVAAVLPPKKAKQWREDFGQLRERWIAKPPPDAPTTTDQ